VSCVDRPQPIDKHHIGYMAAPYRHGTKKTNSGLALYRTDQMHLAKSYGEQARTGADMKATALPMQLMNDISRFAPAEPALRAHCERVAALANLISHRLFLTTGDKAMLQTACLLHHDDAGHLSHAAAERLLRDLGIAAPRWADPVPAEVRAVLKSYHAPGAGTERFNRLAEILRLCNAVDEYVEAGPCEDRDLAASLLELQSGIAAGLWSEEVYSALLGVTEEVRLGSPETWNLPVFPGAALRMVRLLNDPGARVQSVVDAVSQDPVTAGIVMKLANSALLGSRTRTGSLREAIYRLGFATAVKVVTAAAVRPLLGGNKVLEDLWPHSLEAADLAEQIAHLTTGIDAGEAYLAGLVHDAGRIALLSARLYDSARVHGLQTAGCPRVYAEGMILHTDHAVLGGQIAESWRLPADMVEAIALHHRPERTRNRLAHLLYIVEYLCDAGEDIPSLVRLQAALTGLGLTLDDVVSCSFSDVGAWLAAA
jgi:HD-like signal output (HDOD) protein